jgi:hypothetical protein
MRGKGITYDTGFVRDGEHSRPSFDPGLVERELRVIRDELHCTAVRITGGDADRLELAASTAVELGLEVWFSPYPLDLDEERMLALLADCATRAERLRSRGEIVFVTGAELSLMARGFLPGDNVAQRLGAVLSDRELIVVSAARVNEFLARAVGVVRERFGGRVTYASVPIDRVDWTPFDIVSVDLYRSARIAGQFRDGVRALVAQGKPVAVTEFGCATFRGAGDRGAHGLQIVDEQTQRLDGVYERDEAGQAAYLRELLEIFDEEGVDTAFVFLFALYSHPHRPGGDPRDDLDLASYGNVKVLEDRATGELPWEPKAAFAAVADYYRRVPEPLADTSALGAEPS